MRDKFTLEGAKKFAEEMRQMMKCPQAWEYSEHHYTDVIYIPVISNGKDVTIACRFYGGQYRACRGGCPADDPDYNTKHKNQPWPISGYDEKCPQKAYDSLLERENGGDPRYQELRKENIEYWRNIREKENE